MSKRENKAMNRGRTKAEKSTDSLDSDDEDYRKKRDRNNQVYQNLFNKMKCITLLLRIFQAVKRSRVKSKLKTQETLERVTQLKNENSALEEKVKTLTKELGFLKELFLAHASNSNTNKLDGIDLEKLLADDPTSPSSSSDRN